MDNDWISLALVIKTQGRRGEVAVEPHTDIPDRFHAGMRLWALAKSEPGKSKSASASIGNAVVKIDERRELLVEDAWPHKSFVVLKFQGVETISGAELLRGAELQVPRSERATLEPGWTYLSDLIGCTVLDNGREIGKVTDVAFGAGEAPLLVVQGAPKTAYEIPFAEAYLDGIDIERKQVRMRLPDGLLDVNAKSGR